MRLSTRSMGGSMAIRRPKPVGRDGGAGKRHSFHFPKPLTQNLFFAPCRNFPDTDALRWICKRTEPARMRQIEGSSQGASGELEATGGRNERTHERCCSRIEE